MPTTTQDSLEKLATLSSDLKQCMHEASEGQNNYKGSHPSGKLQNTNADDNYAILSAKTLTILKQAQVRSCPMANASLAGTAMPHHDDVMFCT